MAGEKRLPRGGCRFIAGDPLDVIELGEGIYCRKPVARDGSVWCAEHEALIYLTRKELREARKAA
jgi:hypothetical protein